jgi:hypothetical protein
MTRFGPLKRSGSRFTPCCPTSPSRCCPRSIRATANSCAGPAQASTSRPCWWPNAKPQAGAAWAGSGKASRVTRSPFPSACRCRPQDWSGLSLAVGLSLAESLHPDVGLKWPNDLWFQDRKLGGILVEAASMGGRSQVVVGVGLNIRPRDAQGLNTPPAALTELLPELTAPACLARVALPLIQTLLAFESMVLPLCKAVLTRVMCSKADVCTPAMASKAWRWGWALGVRYDCKPKSACRTSTAPRSAYDP